MIDSLLDRLQTKNLWEYKKSREKSFIDAPYKKSTYKDDAAMARFEEARKEKVNG